MKRFILVVTVVLSLVAVAGTVSADCVYIGSCTTWRYVDNHRFLLYGAGGGAIALVHTWGFVYKTSEILPLKDFVCSYENDAFLIDGSVAPLRRVQKIGY